MRLLGKVHRHNIPLVVRVGDKIRKDTGEVASVIKGYERKDAAAATRPAPATSKPHGLRRTNPDKQKAVLKASDGVRLQWAYRTRTSGLMHVGGRKKP